ncbi:MAG TPA: DnaJ domain-containing protein [Caulobacteraceae bacterium]|jgi:DnaJ-domain-containing protein 1|nr:DnaJ domain-containing protein [Caulobacteraceae bacterium]
MIIALVLVAAFAALVWLGRRARKGRADWRLGASILAVLAFGGAAVAGIKDQFVLAAVLAGVGLFFLVDLRDRGRRPNARPKPQPMSARPSGAMTDTEARAILGVSRTAPPSEIKDAYRRLMRTVHPDQGGSPALAAQINAARDQLLGKE